MDSGGFARIDGRLSLPARELVWGLHACLKSVFDVFCADARMAMQKGRKDPSSASVSDTEALVDKKTAPRLVASIKL